MKFAPYHIENNTRVIFNGEPGIIECAKLIIKLRSLRWSGLFLLLIGWGLIYLKCLRLKSFRRSAQLLFQRFFDAVFFAHLVKEPYRENFKKGRLVAEQSRKRMSSRLLLKTDNSYLAIVNVGQWWHFPFYFPNTSIQQLKIQHLLTVLVRYTIEHRLTARKDEHFFIR